jgi:hypothetical protein
MDLQQTPPTLTTKLYPGRFPNMSPLMAAIVGHMVGERYTEPEIVEIYITSDGWAGVSHDDLTSDLIGDATSLERNLANLADAAGLDDNERAEFTRLQEQMIHDYR